MVVAVLLRDGAWCRSYNRRYRTILHLNAIHTHDFTKNCVPRPLPWQAYIPYEQNCMAFFWSACSSEQTLYSTPASLCKWNNVMESTQAIYGGWEGHSFNDPLLLDQLPFCSCCERAVDLGSKFHLSHNALLIGHLIPLWHALVQYYIMIYDTLIILFRFDKQWIRSWR